MCAKVYRTCDDPVPFIMSALESLVEMGFPRNRAEKALAVTGNSGAQVAMDWLFSHQDDPDIDEPYQAPVGSKLGAGDDVQPVEGEQHEEQSAQQVKSLKCDDCGKQLRSEQDAQAHAARSKHTNFSESTEDVRPLTADEKQEQLAKLEQKMKERREQREVAEKQEARQREKMRRKTGRELSDIKQEIELKEAKKIAAERKREKMEDKLARQRVRDQIAKDRADRASREKPQSSTPGQASVAVGPSLLSSVPAKDYETCKLQIRLMGGGTLVHSFRSEDTLVDVNQHILLNQPGPNAPFRLMTSFPRRVFTGEDSKRTLRELGLLPSAVLIQTKI